MTRSWGKASSLACIIVGNHTLLEGGGLHSSLCPYRTDLCYVGHSDRSAAHRQADSMNHGPKQSHEAVFSFHVEGAGGDGVNYALIFLSHRNSYSDSSCSNKSYSNKPWIRHIWLQFRFCQVISRCFGVNYLYFWILPGYFADEKSTQ